MTKIRDFFKNKRNIVIVLTVGVAIIVITTTTILINKQNKPVAAAQAPSSDETSSVTVNVPDIKDDTSSSEVSSQTSSESLKVDGEVSSKANTSSAKITVSAPPKASSTSKPTPPPPSKPKPPVSSTSTPPPTHEVEPVTPPVNPDPNGPQHGDTMKSLIDGRTLYYHVGLENWITEPMWELWSNYPNAKKIMITDTRWEVDTSFLTEGEKIYKKSSGTYVIWCTVQKCWIVEKSYNYNTHTGNDHGQPR
ncbi:hypothetical protein RBG61_06490 [Paludicola sp. MB14-C6]|uniref:hypothetical protein n=1 Tax=Paludihabitans sp. MB14-C6 TaxID=3070656 RepID=UPI0027DACC2A|nr:hypothetical protein [Paludicola sp. MB14-C6]WMJ24309.1 hypothetical protein RBG61_06490 [Paludicola sp. MB14-C6]